MASTPTSTAQLPPAEVAASTIVVHLEQSAASDVVVRTVEIVHKSARTRMSFHENNALAQIVSVELAGEVVALMDQQVEDGVFSNPDYRLNLPGLMLSKARVIVRRGIDGARAVMVRFAMCIGNVTAIFSPQARPWQAGHDQSQLMAAETLENVFMPLMNFADYVQSDIEEIRGHGGEPLANGLERARQRISDLEVYYNMLVEYVSANDRTPARLTNAAVGQFSQMD